MRKDGKRIAFYALRVRNSGLEKTANDGLSPHALREVPAAWADDIPRRHKSLINGWSRFLGQIGRYRDILLLEEWR